MDGLSDNQQLLQRYVERGSEDAFREITRRYVDFVYSVASRRVGKGSGLVDDVVQVVFADLARQAGRKTDGSKLGGWLHRHTCFVASNLLRGERRRQEREREAARINQPELASESDWQAVAPKLDEAIDELSEADREAVVGRFFERCSLRDLARVLGTSEAAMQKRVSRAVDRLREGLAKQGVVWPSGALAALISVHAIEAAPVGMAVAVSTLALGGAAAAAVGSTSFSLVNLMNVKLVVTSGVLLTGLVAVTLTILKDGPDWSNPAPRTPATHSVTIPKDDVQLEPFRTSTGAMEQAGARLAWVATDPAAPLEVEAATLEPGTNAVASAAQPLRDATREARTRVRMLNGQTLVTGGWQTGPDRLTFVFVSPETDPASGSVMLKSSFVEVPERLWKELGLAEFRADGNISSLNSVIGGSEAEIFLAALKGTEGVAMLASPRAVVVAGQQASMSMSGHGGVEMSIELLPRMVPEGEGIDLTVSAQMAPLPPSAEAETAPSPVP